MTAARPLRAGERHTATSRPITRADLVRYAGASEDFNPIHWSNRAATTVGLPGVIAHGMLTLARALAVLTDWIGDPSRLAACEARFVRPVVVPDDDHGVALTVTVDVLDVDADGMTRVRLVATLDGQEVLADAHARIRPPL